MSPRRFLAAPGPYWKHAFLDPNRAHRVEDYVLALPVVARLSDLVFHDRVTFLVGENGSGKSTLLEGLAVAEGCNAEGGSRNLQFETVRAHSKLHEAIRVAKHTRIAPDAWFLRAESFFNVASEIDRLGVYKDYGGGSLHGKSHGEAFLSLFENRFGQGLYLLDEPEAALSPQRQLTFLSLIHNMVREGSQLVIATHSPILMAYPDAWIYVLSDQGIHRTAYEETAHYKVTRSFLECPERSLRILLEEEE